jgi:catechol 2,3-dioxygenase-like lactoylglutathione lyase family enzyme
MITDIASFTIVVRDLNEALEFYVDTLGFERREDLPMGTDDHLAEEKYWVTVAPRNSQVVFLLQPLYRFEGEERQEREALIGKASIPVLYVDNCKRAYVDLSSLGVEFAKVPIDMSYGVEAICKDPYGNRLVLLEKL